MRLSGVRISTARRSTVTVKTAASRVPGLRTSRAGVRRAAARSGLGPAAGLVHSPRPSLPSAAALDFTVCTQRPPSSRTRSERPARLSSHVVVSK